ncbi:MAG: DUF4012 domain-containing protein [Candidatus Jorgensenbacteria bacterium]|nr:DUF4012 domain-containing protein [Candidatus Jorgensenbacteria bacterium]
MPHVPKKNIEQVLVDVKGPRGTHRKAVGKAEVFLAHRAYFKGPLASLDASRSGRSVRWNRFFIYFVSFVVLVGLALGATFFVGSRALRGTFTSRGAAVADNFSRSVEALQAFDPVAASRYLTENQKEFGELENIVGGSGAQTLVGALGGLIPAVGETASLLRDIVKVNVDLLALSASLEKLRAEGLRSFMGDGVLLLASLTDTQEALRAVTEGAQTIKNATGRLKERASYFGALDSFVGERYLSWSGKLYGLDEFLTELKALLSSETDRHVLLMFQNPSEIRPGGGFLGSYADLVVKNGAMVKLDVRDIYDPDGQLFTNFRSPEAFGNWTEWKTRDANWFFDFPTSAEATITLLESSKLYENYGVKFDIAIAVNIKFIETLLAATGPVALPDYDLTLTEQNFLREVQREVELGEGKAEGAPKRILQTVAPILLERLGSMDAAAITKLLGGLEKHYGNKDLMFYARSPKLQHFIRDAGGDGAVYALPSGFWGNYLAVVDANIDGKKSDAVVAQGVTAYVDVATDGASLTDVAVTRTHRGDLERELFWRATNRNYMQIYTPPAADLVLMKGNDPAPRGTELTAKEIERLYPAEKIIEATKKFLTSFQAWSMEAFGKRVFATWMSVAAGKSRTLELRYQVPGKPNIAPKAGDVYTFIYERQSGVLTKLSLTIAAPIGYQWAETEAPRFTYDADDVPGRLVLTLTLAK